MYILAPIILPTPGEGGTIFFPRGQVEKLRHSEVYKWPGWQVVEPGLEPRLSCFRAYISSGFATRLSYRECVKMPA